MKRLVLWFGVVLVASSLAGCCRWCDEHPNWGAFRDPPPGYGYGGYGYGQPVTYAPMTVQGCPCECTPNASAAANTPVAR